MQTIRSIYGDDVEIEIGQCPETHRLQQTNSILVGEIVRVNSNYMNLEDKYYLGYSESKKFRLLWVSIKCERSAIKNPIMDQLLAWCIANEIEPKSIASAMLEFIWTNQGNRTYGVIYESSEIKAPGLLSLAALQEIKDVALGILIKDVIPFEEPKPAPAPGFRRGKGLTLKELGIRIREAGPNNPIYRRGWIVGGTRLKR